MKRTLFLLCTLLIAGCASQQDLTSLKWEVDALRTRLVRQETRLEERDRTYEQTLRQQAELQARYADLQSQLFMLQGSIDQLSVSAGLIPGGETKISALERELEVLRDMLERSHEPESLYDMGIEKFTAGRYDDAIEDFRSYLSKTPDPGLVDNAHFWIGEALYAKGNYEEAILQYDLVVKKYKTSDTAPDSLYKQGLSFLKLGDGETGTLILQQLIGLYPDSEAAGNAEKTLKGEDHG
ncbi:MAG TPA: tol-pal system protein YbgF [Deltaproteobacteria bacterium]|nr:tol-pal system protein YbgF [Deltaproteobacteria bacterium]